MTSSNFVNECENPKKSSYNLYIVVQQRNKFVYGHRKTRVNCLTLGKLFLSLNEFGVGNQNWFLDQLHRTTKLKSWGFISILPFADVRIVAVITKN